MCFSADTEGRRKEVTAVSAGIAAGAGNPQLSMMQRTGMKIKRVCSLPVPMRSCFICCDKNTIIKAEGFNMEC